MSAILKPAGDLTAGVQVVGAVKQYQYDGKNDATSGLETIKPGDGSSDGNSGANILGTVPPGKVGLRQVQPVVQRAAVILDDATAGAVGNALVASYDSTAGHGDPTPPTGSNPADGLSQAPNHE
jgi:hypothetical protein